MGSNDRLAIIKQHNKSFSPLKKQSNGPEADNIDLQDTLNEHIEQIEKLRINLANKMNELNRQKDYIKSY